MAEDKARGKGNDLSLSAEDVDGTLSVSREKEVEVASLSVEMT